MCEEVDKDKIIRVLRRHCTNQQHCLHEKNLKLDALHYVWCSGGCNGGVHRWSENTITEEIVLEAERNTKRLREWYECHKRVVEYETHKCLVEKETNKIC